MPRISETRWVFAQKLRPDFSRRESFDQLKDAVRACEDCELCAKITRSIKIENGVMERAGGKNYLSFPVEFLTGGQSIDRSKESPTLLSSFLIDVHATRVRCAIRNAHMHAAPCHPCNWDNADELHCGSLVVFPAKTPWKANGYNNSFLPRQTNLPGGWFREKQTAVSLAMSRVCK